MEPTIQEEDEEAEEDEQQPLASPTVAISLETSQECATRLRAIVQSGEYRQQYRELLAVKPHSGHTNAR